MKNKQIYNEYHFGLKISKFDENVLKNTIVAHIESRRQCIFHGYSLTMFYLLKNYPGIFDIIQNFDYLLCDGRGFYYFLKLLGIRNISKITLPNLVHMVLDMAQNNNFSVYLLGSTNINNSKAVKNVKYRYSSLLNVEGADGYFNMSNGLEVVNNINKASPDILLVGISTPKKELFLEEYREMISAPIIVNCGGMIDVLADKANLPPKIITMLGLSWIYRVMQDPKRLIKITLKNGILAITKIMPRVIYEYYVKKNKKFSLPEYVGIK